jgi:formylglycine-generating enzyme required for sulfatase activity
MHLIPAARKYTEEAVRFKPLGSGTGIRVARTLFTCELAVQALNTLPMPPENEWAYRHVNVYNPRAALWFDPVRRAWACAAGCDEHPVWGVNWEGARVLCSLLGGRLPSEQEWECFASNNDPSRTYPWGNELPTPRHANFGEHIGATCPVGSFAPSELGLFDVAGNLDEWCVDRFDPSPAARFERVVKGGAWSKDARFLEISARRGKWARLGTTAIGFRPVWDDG